MGSITITYLLIGITILTSLAGFQNNDLLNRMLFYPAEMKSRNEWWRIISHGFIHAHFQHLIFNMLTLFWPLCRIHVSNYFWQQARLSFILSGPSIFSSVPSYFKHKDNFYYRALGASGAISAVLFTTILFNPWQILYLNFFIPIPAILFAIGYVAYSSYMGKKGTDNVGHEAHLWGAVFGLVCPVILKPGIFLYFINQLTHPNF